MGKYFSVYFIKNNYYTKTSVECILGTKYNSYIYNKMNSTFNILKLCDIVKHNTAKFMNRVNE